MFAAVSLLVFMQAAPASANWYAGNRRTAGYGVRADIRTPASQPIMYSGSISSWVSTEDYAGKWAQTGWYFHVDDYAPMDYIEYFDSSGVHHIDDIALHSFNFWRPFEVRNATSTRWDLYIVGTKRGSSYVSQAPPNEVQVLSEVQGSSSNQLRRPSFRTVQFADSYLTYWNFDQANWVENSPYYVVSKTYRYQYETDGP